METSTDDFVMLDWEDAVDPDDPDSLSPPNYTAEQIRKWLEPTAYNAYGSEFNKHVDSHLPGTGNWVLKSAEYQEWYESDSRGLLWLKGIPGSGKSVVAASMIPLLAREGYPVLHFFFRQIIAANHSPAALLRDWMVQLLPFSPILQARLSRCLESHKDLKRLSLNDLWKYLRTGLATQDKVYCVADGLDEMDRGHDEFVKYLAMLGCWKPGQIKVLLTSRPVPDIETSLRSIPKLELRLDADNVDSDIARYVQHRLTNLDLSSADQELVKGAVPGRASGIFIYAKLAMDAFDVPGAKPAEVVAQLPEDINHMYDSLLHVHAERTQIPPLVQRQILEWATHATRPLRLLELADMLNTTEDICKGKDIKHTKGLVVRTCGPLLELLTDERISVAHHSLTEFLKGSTRRSSSIHYPVLDERTTHAKLAIKCIKYLLSGCLQGVKPLQPQRGESMFGITTDDNHITTLRADHAFFIYAAQNWYIHAARAQGETILAGPLYEEIDRLLSDSAVFATWRSIHGPSFDASPIHVLAWAGLDEYATLWVEKSEVDYDRQDLNGDTPLHLCARQGHAAMAKLLLRKSTYADIDNAVGLKPLHHAAQHGHAEVARVLVVDGKVDPLTPKTKETVARRCGNAASSIGHTPLMYACQAGHTDVVKVLTSVENIQQALIWAAKSSQSKVICMLLQHDKIVLDDRSHGSTAMFIASSRRDIGSMDALLGGGADPNLLVHKPWDGRAYSIRGYSAYDEQNEFYGMKSPTHVYCNPTEVSSDFDQSHLDPAEVRRGLILLHQAGADLVAPDGSGMTPLHHACRSKLPGALELVRYLIEHGADPNTRDAQGMTPLFDCAEPDVVRYLCEQGADPNVRRHGDHKTPLLHLLESDRRSYTSRQLPVSALVHAGADTSVTDQEGNAPLHLAVRKGDVEYVRALLESGAGVGARNHAGETPLFMVALRSQTQDSSALIRLLTDSGADLESKDNQGRTVLFRAIDANFTDFSKPTWQILLNAGANIHTRDFGRRNLFFPLATRVLAQRSRPKTNLFGMKDRDDMSLDELGVKPEIDVDGNTPFHILAQRIHNRGGFYRQDDFEPMVETLLAYNVRPEQANHSQWTPLHSIVSVTSTSGLWYAKQFLRLADNIDAQDCRGVTALHIACTISEGLTELLLQGGANASITTFDGLTVLHLSARAKQSNVLAMVLEHMRELNTIASMIDARDRHGRTALHHACRSGLHESVALLLDAGADHMSKDSTRLTPLDACVEFEAEQALWSSDPVSQPRRAGIAIEAAGFNLLDTRRPSDHAIEDGVDKSVGTTRTTPRSEAGLEDIVALIVETSPDEQVEQLRKMTDRIINACVALDRQYTLGVFLVLATRLGPSTDATFYRSVIPERELLKAQYHAAVPAIREHVITTDWLTHLDFHHLINLRRHDAIQAFVSEGLLDLTKPDEHGHTPLHVIIEKGFVGLLTCFCRSPAGKTFDPKQFYRACAEARYASGKSQGLMLTAARRLLPSLHILKMLHEELGIDLDETVNPDVHANSEQAERAIHLFAQGRHFWQVSQGLPYLLHEGAAIQVSDAQGDTPLHIALRTLAQEPERSPTRAVKLLLEAGADVSILNSKGESCLSGIIAQPALLQSLLRRKGVIVTADAVFAAIKAGNVGALRALLHARPDIVHGRLLDKSQDKMRNPQTLGRVQDWEYSALHFAAICPWSHNFKKEDVSLEARVQIVNVLLDYGADPFSKFYYMPKVGEQDDLDEFSALDYGTGPSQASGTVLHAIVEIGGIIKPFLERSVDIEQRDQLERTLLLAACSSKLGPDASIDSVSWKQSTTDAPQRTILETLLALGADVSAVDHQGRSALHLLAIISGDQYTNLNFNLSVKLLCQRHPELMTWRDFAGNTPLFSSLAQAGRGIATAKLLLECGSDVSTLDAKGNSILHAIAAHIGFANDKDEAMQLFRQLLIQHDLDINTRNTTGETPLAVYVQKFRINTHPTFGSLFTQPRTPGAGSAHPDPPVVAAFKSFISLGADPITTTLQNHNLLHLLAKRPSMDWAKEDRFGDLKKHLRIAWRFLWKEVGVDAYMEDVAGRTAWDFVVASGGEVGELEGKSREEEDKDEDEEEEEEN